ncbi:helix-turn-helix transcriptional regulator [Yersinia enterocolitica]
MKDTTLGMYLRERRIMLDPTALGFVVGRRRTPGLRREEVAQRAGISTVWYSWLEQGRGGAPSADVLDRIAHALMLTDVEREYLFLIGLGRPPEINYHPPGSVTPRLQRVLDRMQCCPALLRTVTWDVIAWNAAATTMFVDYGALPPEERNQLRLIFLDPEFRKADTDWECVARHVVGVFRAGAARAGASETIKPLVAELSHRSPDFARMWEESKVGDCPDEGRSLRHPILGEIEIEYSAFAVDGRPDLTMIVYNPVSDADADRIRVLATA